MSDPAAPGARDKSSTVGDPLIDEVRSIRRAISEQHGNDVDRLCDRLQELERAHSDWTVVSVPPGAVVPDGDR